MVCFSELLTLVLFEVAISELDVVLSFVDDIGNFEDDIDDKPFEDWDGLVKSVERDVIVVSVVGTLLIDVKLVVFCSTDDLVAYKVIH